MKIQEITAALKKLECNATEGQIAKYLADRGMTEDGVDSDRVVLMANDLYEVVESSAIVRKGSSHAPSTQRAMTKRGAKTRQNKSIVSQTSQEVDAYTGAIDTALSAYEGHQAAQLVDRIRSVPHNIREQVETALEVAEYDPQSFSEDANDLLGRLGIQMEIPVGTVSALVNG